MHPFIHHGRESYSTNKGFLMQLLTHQLIPSFSPSQPPEHGYARNVWSQSPRQVEEIVHDRRDDSSSDLLDPAVHNPDSSFFDVASAEMRE